MARRKVIIQAALVLALVWACVGGVRYYAASKKITAERVNETVEQANFADWSASAPADPAEAKRLDEELRRIAGLVNRLDFQQREKNRDNRTGETFFRKLSPAEKSLFIELTVVESMSRFMESLDSMEPGQRRKFVEQGLKEIQDGRTADEMARAEELDDNLLETISQ